MTTDTKKLQAELGVFKARLKRQGESLEFLQIISKTFVSLSLNDKAAICDTFNSMVSSFMDARKSATLLLCADGNGYDIVSRQGVIDPEKLSGSEASELWRWVISERIARFVDGEDLGRRCPSLTEVFPAGFACVPIDIREQPVGLIVLADKVSGTEFSGEELEFLSAAAGIVAVTLTNAESHATQEGLIRSVEQQAKEAQQLAQERELALEELDRKLEIIERQRFAIQELSTPVLQLWDDVLALPVIGVVDTRRSADIMERLLAEITEKQVRFVILDITGVEVVDTRTADHFIKVIKAAELLGSTCILTGIRPAVAQTLIEIGVDMSSFTTLRNMQEGLTECLRRMRDLKSSDIEEI